MKLFLAAATIMVGASSAMAADDAVNNAFRVCKMIDNTGLFTAPCQVSSRRYAVIGTIDLPSADARKACAQIAGVVSSKGFHFPGGEWTVQIKSPTSGDKSIAFCRLPK
jgi:opacity protein-like surface antigen